MNMLIKKRSISAAASLNMLKARLHGLLSATRVVAVTSATINDGTMVLAYMIGQDLVRNGVSTLIIDCQTEFPTIAADDSLQDDSLLRNQLDNLILSGNHKNADVLSLASISTNLMWSEITARRVIQILSESYQLIVINAPNAVLSEQALAWIRAAKVAIISVQKDRAVCELDKHFKELLSNGTDVLGAVVIESKAITTFAVPALRPARKAITTVRGEHRLVQPVLESN